MGFGSIFIQVFQYIEIVHISFFYLTQIGIIRTIVLIISVFVVRPFVRIGKSGIFQGIYDRSCRTVIPDIGINIPVNT